MVSEPGQLFFKHITVSFMSFTKVWKNRNQRLENHAPYDHFDPADFFKMIWRTQDAYGIRTPLWGCKYEKYRNGSDRNILLKNELYVLQPAVIQTETNYRFFPPPSSLSLCENCEGQYVSLSITFLIILLLFYERRRNDYMFKWDIILQFMVKVLFSFRIRAATDNRINHYECINCKFCFYIKSC